MRADPQALQRLVEQLNELHAKAGWPTLPYLRKLSQQAIDAGHTDLRLLVEATTSEILNGKRVKPPPGPWLASFVTACRTAVARTGVDPDQLGMGTLTEWSQRLHAACTPAPPSPAPDEETASATRQAATETAHKPEPTPPGHNPGVGPGQARTDRSGVIWRMPPELETILSAVETLAGRSWGEPIPASEMEEVTAILAAAQLAAGLYEECDPPAELTVTMQRILRSYGRTGARLLRRAEAKGRRPSEVAQAAFQLAVLLLCADRPAEGRIFLRKANAAGHPDALELYHHPVAIRAACEIARQIGEEYAAHSHTSSALVFFQAAAECEDGEASYRTAQIYLQQDKLWEAATWFSRAARLGHRHARHEFNAISRQLAAPYLENALDTPTSQTDWPGDPPAFA